MRSQEQKTKRTETKTKIKIKRKKNKKKKLYGKNEKSFNSNKCIEHLYNFCLFVFHSLAMITVQRILIEFMVLDRYDPS